LNDSSFRATHPQTIHRFARRFITFPTDSADFGILLFIGPLADVFSWRMVMAVSCPSADVLEQLVLGRITGPQGETLEDHLTRCSHCLVVLQSLPAEDDVVSALRSPFIVGTLPRAEMAASLGPMLKRLANPSARRDYSTEQSGTMVLDSAPIPASRSITLDGDPLQTTDGTDEATPPGDEVQPGDQLGGYRLVKLLGAGGMGAVWQAEELMLKRFVALKVIARSLVGRGEVRERFLVEAQALAQLEHDHIVTVYQIAEDRGIPYLAMQLLQGESLHDHLKSHPGPLSIDDALRIARETATGLAIAHDRGLVHRDIKPGNLWLDSTTGGRVKILDFGLVRALCDEADGSGRIIGTPAYMAPEQAACEAVDGRADLFALGCVLYQAVTGKLPFTGESILALLLAVRLHHPPTPRSLNKTIPPALDRLIQRLMAKNPNDRPANAREVIAAIVAVEHSRRPNVTRRWVIGAGLALVGGVGVGTWAAMSFFPPPVDPPEPPMPKLTLLDQHRSHLGWPVVGLAARAGDVFSTSGDRTLVRWEPTKGKKPEFVWHRESPLRCLAMSPDGKTMATGSGEVGPRGKQWIQLWDVATMDRKGEPWECKHPVSALAFSPDGKWIFSGENDGSLAMWDIALGTDEWFIEKGHNGQGCTAVLFLPDGKRVLSVGGDGSVVVREQGDGKKVVQRWTASTKPVRAVALRGEEIITASQDSRLRVWKLGQATPVAEIETPAPVLALAVAPDGRLLTGDAAGTLRLWSSELKPEPVEPMEAHPDGVVSVIWLVADRRAISGGVDGVVKFWELPS